MNYFIGLAHELATLLDFKMNSSHPASDSAVDEKEALYEAIVDGNVHVVEGLLQKHPELINCELKDDSCCASPLVLACYIAGEIETGYDEIIGLLLKYGADPNSIGYFGCRRLGFDRVTPLTLIAWKAFPTLSQLPINAGADINQTDSMGQTTSQLCFNSSSHRNNVIEILLSQRTNVSAKDVNGKTPLHYACEILKKDAVKFLLDAGVEMNISDSSGFTELQLAAQSHCDAGAKVQLLLDSYAYPVETVIEAYETLAWSLLQNMGNEGTSEFPLDPVANCMRKATHLRQENNIPKQVLGPLECHDFVKEWETIEDLLNRVSSREQLMVQAMLSRERIYKGRHRHGPLLQYIIFHFNFARTKKQLNASLMHHLDLYEESKAAKNMEGCFVLTSLSDILGPWLEVMLFENPQQPCEFEDIDTDSIARIVRVVIDSYQEIKPLLEKGTFAISSESDMLICISIEYIHIATEIIMKLYKRNRSTQGIYKTEKILAKKLLGEIIGKIGDIVSPSINFRRPVQHIILKKYLTTVSQASESDILTDDDICKVLVDCISDIDATDSEGNTLLHLVAEQCLTDYQDPHCSQNPLIILNFLVDLVSQGAYIYARNNEGKTVIDYIADAAEKTRWNDEKLIKTLETLKNKVPPLQTIAAIRAKGQVFGDVPERFKRFIDRH